MDENRVAGTAPDLGGKAQETFGRATGDTGTAAEGATREALQADLTFLHKIWKSIEETATHTPPGALVYEDLPPLIWNLSQTHYRRRLGSWMHFLR